LGNSKPVARTTMSAQNSCCEDADEATVEDIQERVCYLRALISGLAVSSSDVDDNTV
jgi:hypothetical protein